MLKTIAFSILTISTINVYAQGCADAGFCSVGAMQHGLLKEKGDRNTAGFSVAVASGEKRAWVISPQLEIKAIVNNNSYIDIKLPYQIVTGNLGGNFGIGDLISTYTHRIKTKNEKLKMNYTAGLRVGLGNADDQLNGKSLPMAYQTSLGTTDVILGISANVGKYFVLAAGIQQPVLQYNDNGYHTIQNRDSIETVYFSSRHLRRAGDALLRIEAKKDWKHTGIHGGPLLLYHLTDDKSILADGTQITLQNSAGFTININLGFYYRTDKWVFDFTVAGPVYARDNRPDGLTRNAIVIPRITFNL
ncbi:MAG: hypothetical protein JNK00_09700 [Flavipsychrobacter sp.]|nr:hypothetical protein [Flavipsychrobacter sp.]